MESRLKRVLTSQVNSLAGQKVTIAGWVRLRRDHGKLIFLDLRDRDGLIQVVVNPKVSERAYEAAKELKPEYVVEIEGLINKRPENAIKKELISGEVELEAREIRIISKADTLPFDMGGEKLNLELPTLFDYRSVSLRHPSISAIFKVQRTIAKTFRETLEKDGFTEIFVPTIVPVATEGGAEVFPIDYYDKKAYLGQSPQLYKQIMVSIFERVFTIAHAYRAEPSVTTRHLSEYVSLDAEMGLIESWDEIMDVVEKVVSSILKKMEEENQPELKILGVKVPVISKRIPRVKLLDAQEIVYKRTKIDHRNEPDLDPSDEKELCKYAEEETGAPFIFITHFPISKRPFYTMPDKDDPKKTLSFDLLGVSEEWVTGGQRINDYEKLVENIKKRGMKEENFQIYLQAFKFGMPPEGGFALGIERITKDLLGLANIREASLFPRDMERIDERLSSIK